VVTEGIFGGGSGKNALGSPTGARLAVTVSEISANERNERGQMILDTDGKRSAERNHSKLLERNETRASAIPVARQRDRGAVCALKG